MKKVLVFVMVILMAAPLFAGEEKAGPRSSSFKSSSLMVDFQYTTNPTSRKKFKIAYIMPFQSPYTAAMCDQWKLLSKKLNYDFSSFEAGNDTDKFMTLIETAAGQKFDGLMMEGDTTTMDRIFEIMKGYPAVQFMPGLSPYDDANHIYKRPSVVVASYERGQAVMQYAIDNYKKATNSNIDMKDVGFITVNWSVITDFNDRVAGALSKYKSLFPNLVKTNYFAVDTVPEKTPITAEAALNQVTPIIAANKKFKGWIIFGCIEDYGDGSSRALETAGLDKTSIVVSDSSAMLMRKWDTGYKGCWIAGVDTPQVQWADGIVSGLLQLIEKTKTPETLWTSLNKDKNQKYTVIHLPYTVVNKDNVKDYAHFMNTYLDTKYPGKK